MSLIDYEIINEDTFVHVLWYSEGKLLARIVNFLSNTVSLVSELFVFFAVAIVLGAGRGWAVYKIIADSAKQS